MTDCKRHKWTRKGGCKENPGVWGIGGAAISITETCERCNMVRDKVTGDVEKNGNRNHGGRMVE
jgi:hypothetical protein